MTRAACKDDLRITFTPLEHCAKDGVIDRIDFIFARGFRVDRASHAGDKDWPSDHRMVIAEVSKLKVSAKPKSTAEPAKKEAKARTVKRPASATSRSAATHADAAPKPNSALMVQKKWLVLRKVTYS